MMTHWKPASAFVYTLICLCDFVVFPAYVGINRVDLVQLIGLMEGMEPTIQTQLLRSATNGYEPFTLRGSGLFHLAFGALLTGAAITKHADGLAYDKSGAHFKRRESDAIESDKSKSNE